MRENRDEIGGLGALLKIASRRASAAVSRLRRAALILPGLTLAVAAAGFLGGSTPARAADNFMVGPTACQNCHKPEFEVWSKTKHSTSFNEFHRLPKVRDVLKATNERSPKQSKVCVTCHYTTAQKDAAAKPDQVAGPACESCHGPASKWITIHNDFGGAGVKAADEKPDHKAKRIADAKAAGMVRPESKFDVVENCYGCHALGRPDVDGKVLGAMIDNGHPTNDDFEFVRYAEGQVRHRFYPPDTSANKEMTPQLKAEWYAVGQAAALVAASQGASKSDNAKYKAAETARIAKAKEVLGKIPEAKQLLATPTADAGRAFSAAINGKDLTKVVGALPEPSTYK